jgi:hypothetical protein
MPLDPNVLAYRDTLDGRTRSKYYYIVRAESPSGLLGPPTAPFGPVSCPDVVPPSAPALAAVYGREDAIRLEWLASPEADLAEYRVYRAEDPALAEDLRSMTWLATVTGSPPAPEHVDATVKALQPYTYRVVAVDTSGNVSTPSAAATGRAIHTAAPAPQDIPALTAQWQGAPRPHAQLAWAASAALELRVDRRPAGATEDDYQAVSGSGNGAGPWLAPGAASWVDRPFSGQWEYRLVARNAVGLTTAGPATKLT